MEQKGHHSPSYQALIKAGPRLKPLQQVQARLVVSGFGRSRSLLTKLLSLACAAGSIAYVRRLFFFIPNPDAFLFDTLIKQTSKFSFSIDSLLFYRRMILSNFSPSNYTFTAVIKSCADLSALKLGRVIHTHVFVRGYGLDLHVQAALVSFYAKSCNLSVARKLFDKMPGKTVVAWNSMISGYEQNGFAKEATGLFYLMRDLSVKPDSTTCVIVLSACAQLGAIGLGRWLHASCSNTQISDLITQTQSRRYSDAHLKSHDHASASSHRSLLTPPIFAHRSVAQQSAVTSRGHHSSSFTKSPRRRLFPVGDLISLALCFVFLGTFREHDTKDEELFSKVLASHLKGPELK
ncbi:hypothetical protein Pint_10570 [Pistacia integerrima]|uniref:Uncharacterized protein n=1 Tax=Pistacia integerrima TaxID=434235 RepID=A0ACC0XHB8_9ROSI|nr:hypothetical protein Pint_10570 [Pistacia integerrima]